MVDELRSVKSETHAAKSTKRAFLAPRGGKHGRFLFSSRTGRNALLASRPSLTVLADLAATALLASRPSPTVLLADLATTALLAT